MTALNLLAASRAQEDLRARIPRGISKGRDDGTADLASTAVCSLPRLVDSEEHPSPHIFPMAWYSSVMGVEQRSATVVVSADLRSMARLGREGVGRSFAPRCLEDTLEGGGALRARGKVLFLARRVLGRCREISPWVRSKAEESERLRMVGGKRWGQMSRNFECRPALSSIKDMSPIVLDA